MGQKLNVCELGTSEGGHQDTCRNSEGATGFHGGSLKDCAHNYCCLGALSLAALWQRGSHFGSKLT